MVPSLKFKPDFARTAARFEAWWHGEILDRPPVSASVRPVRPYNGPVAQHATQRERWMDIEFAVQSAIAHMARTDYVADALPIFFSNIGPEITATWFGCELEFSQHSSWSHPVVNAPEDWARVATMQPDFGNVYWQTMLKATDLAIAMNDGRYLIGMTDLHGNYDILAALRDPQTLCMDLLDCPELVEPAAKAVTAAFNESFCQCYRQVSAAGMGSTCWTNFWHDGPAYVPSCDFWCMVSPEIAREMIFPKIVEEMGDLKRSIFHLDGALRLLDLTMELPGLNAVQWVYGDGHGPAARWIDVYKRILAAGKSIQVLANDPADAMTVLEAVGPRGVWLQVGGQFERASDVEAFLKDVQRVTVQSRK